MEASELKQEDHLAENDDGKSRFLIRRLNLSDYKKGFMELLSQLTHSPHISEEEFESRFNELLSLGDDHLICVIEDEQSKRIIATGCVFVEKKFIRKCGKVGHIEDVVVDSAARGNHLGNKIVQYLSDYVQSRGCYKVILDASMENKGFYEKCGFKLKEIQMVKYFI